MISAHQQRPDRGVHFGRWRGSGSPRACLTKHYRCHATY